MASYDFNVLSPIEFEDFSKDIVESRLGIEFENFAEGKDGGIDLRYSTDKEKNAIIVQCKRYKSVSGLVGSLKSEAVKLKKLSPSRYILITNVELSPAKKDEIELLLTPYIKSTTDIIDRSMLNSSLSKLPLVERKHHKLWISSTEVLKNVLHSQIYTHTALVEDDIKRTLKVYAQTPSFDEATKILSTHHVLIIAGLPGVGKTTLAQMLAYKLLGDKSFDSFIALSGDIHEALDAYEIDTSKKQLFLFDDFLGTNLLKQTLNQNSDTMLDRLVRHIKLSDNKALILTTREYILKQAKRDFDLLNKDDFLNSEYILDVSKYDKVTKARILYNHIAVSEIPSKYLSKFLEDRIYIKIIDHANYSPRLIETISKEALWNNRSPEEFCDVIMDYFDNPTKLYNEVFENKISQLAQDILLVMMTIGQPVNLSHLANSVINHSPDSTEIKIERAIDEIEGTFVSTFKKEKSEEPYIDFRNPSIHDFLIEKFRAKPHTLKKLIESAAYINQLTSLFTFSQKALYPASLRRAEVVLKVKLSNELKSVYVNKIQTDFDSLHWLNNPINDSSTEPRDTIDIVARLIFEAEMDDSLVKDLFIHRLKEYLTKKVTVRYVSEALDLYIYYYEELSKDERSYANFVESIIDSVSSIRDLDAVDEIELQNEKLHRDIADGLADGTKVYEILDIEIEEAEIETLDELSDELSVYVDRYELDKFYISERIDERMTPSDIDGSEFYTKPDNYDYKEHLDHSGSDEDAYIDSMFKSL